LRLKGDILKSILTNVNVMTTICVITLTFVNIQIRYQDGYRISHITSISE
jgi:hypothetical protein